MSENLLTQKRLRKTMSGFEPGFYENIEFSDYLADPAVNNSSLKIFSQSAAKYAYWRNNDRPGTGTQAIGSATHCLILENKSFEIRFGKTAAPKAGSVARTKWDLINPRAIPLTPKMWDDVHNMAQAFKSTNCSIARELLSDGVPELSIFWIDPISNLRCKIRIDCLKDNSIIVDVKSTVDASPRGFLREIWKWQYQIQASFYLRGLTTAYQSAGVNRQVDAFIFIAIESSPPHEIACYVLANSILEEANNQIDGTLARYKTCAENDKWLSEHENEIIVLGDNND